eukprot:TRINITY_DN3685_c0_g1_i1.p1 TRINITY_DN3685_c0_g1~~TRINITY_DN3685_c0_g1_i1.p1  ORF type:complete len:174 (-),score=41.33 TRINITY_DN3685_c0_g1_i1:657-1178(-)
MCIRDRYQRRVRGVFGEMSGEGVYKYTSGHVYEGSWKNHKRCGKGTLKFASGEVYSGDWLDDKPEGTGTFTYFSGPLMWVSGKQTKDMAWDNLNYQEDRNIMETGRMISYVVLASLPLQKVITMMANGKTKKDKAKASLCRQVRSMKEIGIITREKAKGSAPMLMEANMMEDG